MTKMLLAEDDDMIKALPSDRTNKPFRIAVLPCRLSRNRSISNPHRPKPPDKRFAVGAVAIANEISRRLRRSDGRSQLAAEVPGANAAKSEDHRAAEMQSSAPRIGPSMRCRRHDYEERSANLAKVAVFSSPYTLPRWSARYRCRA